MIKKIVLATQNPGKITDIKRIFAKHNFNPEIIIPENITEPEENGDSFFANALIKAKFYAQHYNLPAISDDSGLMIECLDNFPGIHTREFADSQEGYENAFNKLEEMLEEYNPPFTAKFVSTIVFSDPATDDIIPVQAELKGIIDFTDKKNNNKLSGFGYSPIFIAEGYDRSLAQLSLEEYYNINHRSKSVEMLLSQIHNK